MSYIGEVIAILCAVSWSVSLILLKIAGTKAHPLVLNLGKNTLGFLLLLPTVYIFEGGISADISMREHAILFLSGFLGIGIADALVLKAMNHLTATSIALLECLFTPFVVILSISFLNENLTLAQLIGASLVAAGILLITPKERQQATDFEAKKLARLGAVLMAIGLFTMAVGILIVKPLFETIPLFSIVTLRMAAGILGSLVALVTLKNRKSLVFQLLKTDNKPLMLAAFIMSSYVAISLWIAGYKYLNAPAAAILNQTSTFFTVLLAVVFLKEKMTIKKALATLLATGGVIITSLN